MVVVDTPNFSAPPPGPGSHQNVHIPKFPPAGPPGGPIANATGPPVIGPDGQPVEFDGKRLRKTMMRKTVDYNSSFVNMLHNRVYTRDYRDRPNVQPDICFYPDVMPPQSTPDNPVNCVTTRFVKTATNKMRCPIFCLSWTPEGRRLITGASSGEFTLWNGLTFNFETILQAHDSPVRAMQWSHNDVWMVTGDHSGYIKYWQSNMNNVKMFQAHKEPIRRVTFSPTDAKFASCSDDGTVRIWDFQRCYEEKVLRGHGADVKCVDWHPQKGIVVSGSKDSQQPIKLWDPKSGQTLFTIHAHKSTVMDCSWNKNGNWLLTASRDHLLKLFDIRNLKEELQTFRGHKKEASCVQWHPIHEGMFASGGSDGSIMYWNVGAEKETGVIENAHENIVWCLSWHPAGHILATGSNDHTVKFWSRNRPGDSMRDKYNLNTLPPGVEEDYGNIGDFVDTSKKDSVKASVAIPGMAPEDRVESSTAIPGLEFHSTTDLQVDLKKKQPFSKPIPKSFQSSWNTDNAPDSDRGTKRPYEAGAGRGGQVPGLGPENLAPMASGPGTGSIPLALLQQQAASIVAKGQIIPLLPASPLYHSLSGGEAAIKDVLVRELNIGSSGGGGGGGFSSIPGPAFNVNPQGGQNFGGFNQQGGGAGNFGGNSFGGGGGGGNRRQNWDRGGRNNRI